ncbi:MAG TPA: PEP_CTERM-anchored TLD domain-containing protein [Lacunisphaera sp.]
MKMHITHRPLRALLPLAASLLLAFVPVAQATPLLTSAYETQLEAWLGQGDLVFTNVFTKQAGDDAYDFHAAADGKGATFTLMSISGPGWWGTFDLPNQIIGGYNPQSWSSVGNWNLSPSDGERTAFLYNLTSGIIQKQNLTGQGFIDSGLYQTYGVGFYGPTFGGGHDLYTSDSLNNGYAYNWSFGGTSSGDEIISGGPNYSTYSLFNIGALEVWTFAPAQTQGGGNTVPDTTATLGLLGAALLGMATLRRVMV